MTKAKPIPKPEPCPWCGGKAETLLPQWTRYVVECCSIECLARGPLSRTERGAIAAWNRVAK